METMYHDKLASKDINGLCRTGVKQLVASRNVLTISKYDIMFAIYFSVHHCKYLYELQVHEHLVLNHMQA